MDVSFTDRELDLMDVLWDRGSATVPEVQEQLAGDPAYTTVSTLLRILVDKGYVEAKEEGRSHRYYPLVDRQTAGESALRKLTRKIFKDSPELALTHLVSASDLTEEQIKRVQNLLDRQLKEPDL
jgi:predicted transcriptional regulator